MIRNLNLLSEQHLNNIFDLPIKGIPESHQKKMSAPVVENTAKSIADTINWAQKNGLNINLSSQD